MKANLRKNLMYELRKAKEALTYWNSDTALWEKHQMVVPITQPISTSRTSRSRGTTSQQIDIHNLVCYN
ncbi:MAG: hypothetical protein CM15mV98_070 [uncultured marine virus]|nr:MAG: hypothetical protein CM15mV98_070 [uncultured marine virus]